MNQIYSTVCWLMKSRVLQAVEAKEQATHRMQLESVRHKTEQHTHARAEWKYIGKMLGTASCILYSDSISLFFLSFSLSLSHTHRPVMLYWLNWIVCVDFQTSSLCAHPTSQIWLVRHNDIEYENGAILFFIDSFHWPYLMLNAWFIFCSSQMMLSVIVLTWRFTLDRPTSVSVTNGCHFINDDMLRWTQLLISSLFLSPLFSWRLGMRSFALRLNQCSTRMDQTDQFSSTILVSHYHYHRSIKPTTYKQLHQMRNQIRSPSIQINMSHRQSSKLQCGVRYDANESKGRWQRAIISHLALCLSLIPLSRGFCLPSFTYVLGVRVVVVAFFGVLHFGAINFSSQISAAG